MTQLLQEAFDTVSQLSEQEQNAYAAWLLEELASERQWEKAFADSADVLSQLAGEALSEHRNKKTHLLTTADPQ